MYVCIIISFIIIIIIIIVNINIVIIIVIIISFIKDTVLAAGLPPKGVAAEHVLMKMQGLLGIQGLSN